MHDLKEIKRINSDKNSNYVEKLRFHSGKLRKKIK